MILELQLNSLLTSSMFFKGLKSFHKGNKGSVGQRAAKLLAFKAGDQKKVCRFGHYCSSTYVQVHVARIQVAPSLNLSQMTDSSFAVL